MNSINFGIIVNLAICFTLVGQGAPESISLLSPDFTTVLPISTHLSNLSKLVILIQFVSVYLQLLLVLLENLGEEAAAGLEAPV